MFTDPLDWIYYLSLAHKLFLGLGGLIFDFLYVFWFSIYITNVYRKTKSKDLTLKRVKLFNRTIYLLILLFDAILNFSITLTLFFRSLNKSPGLLVLISFGTAFFLFWLLNVINHQITFKITKEMSELPVTRMERFKRSFGLLMTLVVLLLVFTIANLLLNNRLGDFYNGYGSVSLAIIVGLLIGLIFQSLLVRILKATPLNEPEMNQQLLVYAKKAGVTNITENTFYSFPSKEKRIRENVIVSSVLKKRIFIADILTTNLTVKQTESLIVHGLLQIKRNYLWKRLAIGLSSIIPMFVIASLLGWVESYFWLSFSLFTVFCFYFLFLIIYLYVFLTLTFRKLTRQIDQTILDLGIDYRDLVSALLKINELNEKRSKRPFRSTTKRIESIIHMANGSLEDIKSYLDEKEKEVTD